MSRILKESKPYTFLKQGIIDYKKVAQKLKQLLEEKNCQFFFNAKVTGIEVLKDTVKILTTSGNFFTTKLINCTGLYADKLAKLSGEKINFQILPFRGEYYQLK